MNHEELKHCIIPGCGKELPRGTKLPICDYHKGEAKEKAEGAVKGAVGVGVLVVGVVKSNGLDLAKEYLPKAGKVVKDVITKRI